jgi:hypothetical protein
MNRMKGDRQHRRPRDHVRERIQDDEAQENDQRRGAEQDGPLDRAVRRFGRKNAGTLITLPHRVNPVNRSPATGLHRLITAAVLVAGLAPSANSQGRGTTKLPAGLETYLTTVVHPNATERARLLSGMPLTRLLEADVTKELAVFGAIWINAPIANYLEAVKDIERFEQGGRFKVTRRISTPPRIEDFADMHLTAEDLDDLRDCRVGDCNLKLSQQGLQAIRTEIDWKAPMPQARADAVMRRLALDYVRGYLEKGNAGLAVYRDSARPTFVAEELRSLVDQMPALSASIPALRRYLLEYPAATLPDAASFLYWQETQFGLKPTIRISHLVIVPGAEESLIASKMLYATHYFWTALELRVMVHDPARGPGFWLVTINRSRTDGLTGFTGFFIRRRARSDIQAGTRAVLEGTKQLLETGH